MHCNLALQSICELIGDELEELARRRSRHEITERNFVEAILKIESEQVQPQGFSLCVSNTIDDWTVFKLRSDGSEAPCAAFEFLPETGEFRRPGSGPSYPSS